MTGSNRETERERREAAQAHKGEAAEVVGPVAPRDMRQMLSVRVEGELAGQLRQLARTMGISVSDLLREAAAKVVEEHARQMVTLRVHAGEAPGGLRPPGSVWEPRFNVTYWDEQAHERHQSGDYVIAGTA